MINENTNNENSNEEKDKEAKKILNYLHKQKQILLSYLKEF